MTPEVVVQELARAGCVFAEEEAAVLLASAETDEELAAMLARRVVGEPLEQVVGWAEFRGLRFEVAEGVFVPRQRSNLLVDEAVALARSRTQAAPAGTAVVVDLCCGVGALGAAVASEVPGTELHAVDLDSRALGCARRNLERWEGRVHGGDLFAALPGSLRGRVDVVVTSPPYVPSEAVRLLPGEARDHEPLVALDGGVDGLGVVRRIVRDAPAWLSRGGALAVEVGASQVAAAAGLLEELGWRTWCAVSEEDGAAAVVGRLTR